MTLSILGMGFSHPENQVTNDFILSLGIDTSREWILDKIGIERRLTSLPESYISETKNADPTLAPLHATDTPLSLAVRATDQACDRAGIKADQIGLIITNTCTPRATLPSESARIRQAIGADAAASYDVFSACPAFALHIDYLRQREESALPEYILMISTGTMTQHVNYTDRTDPAIWADGASACIVSTRHQGKLKVLASTFTADPTRSAAVVVDTYGHFHQDGRAVRDFSVRQTVRMIKSMEEEHGLDWSKDIFIGHQANATMLQQIIGNRSIPQENHWSNVTMIGNQAGASASIVLAQHWDQIKPGMKIVVAVVGAGLSWGSVLLEA